MARLYTAYPDLVRAADGSAAARGMDGAVACRRDGNDHAGDQSAREYTLEEIATMTRAAPARLLGLRDRGHLAVGAKADVAVYAQQRDKAAMFRNAAFVFKDGDLVVRDGQVQHYQSGRALTVERGTDGAIERRMRDYYEGNYGVDANLMKVPAGALAVAEPFELVSCRS